MKTPIRNRARLMLPLVPVLAICFCIPPVEADDKLTPADLVAKHLESIGTAEARARVNGTKIKGDATVTVKLCGEGQVDGQVVMASHDAANLINMNFDIAAYPLEAMRFDGKKLTVSQLRPGSRTCLANFFISHDVMFKEGLMGGVLSESWALLSLQERSPKLEYGGLKKMDHKDLHVLKYNPRKGSDLKITIYFDAATFRHVRTDYSRTIYASEQRRIAPGGPGLPPAGNQQASAARIEAREEFADFKDEAGLNLPHTYKFHLSIQSETKPAIVDWVFNLKDYAFTSPIDAAEFSIANEAKNQLHD